MKDPTNLANIMTHHRTPQFSVVMKRLTEDKDNLNNLVAACPGLEQDQVALALLAKPENLMMVFTPDPHSAEQGMDVWKGKMQKMAKDHPALLQAIENMIAAVHEEKPSGAVGAFSFFILLNKKLR